MGKTAQTVLGAFCNNGLFEINIKEQIKPNQINNNKKKRLSVNCSNTLNQKQRQKQTLFKAIAHFHLGSSRIGPYRYWPLTLQDAPATSHRQVLIKCLTGQNVVLSPSSADWKKASTSPGPQHNLPRPWVGSFFLVADTKRGNCCQCTTSGSVVDLSKPRSYNTYS